MIRTLKKLVLHQYIYIDDEMLMITCPCSLCLPAKVWERMKSHNFMNLWSLNTVAGVPPWAGFSASTTYQQVLAMLFVGTCGLAWFG